MHHHDDEDVEGIANPEDLHPINDVSMLISRLFVEGVMVSNTFVKSKGKKMVLARPTLGAPPGAMLDTCAKLKSTFMVAGERGVFCDNDRDRAFHGQSVILPATVVQKELSEMVPTKDRDILLYLRIPCYRTGDEECPAKILIQSIESKLESMQKITGVQVIPSLQTCAEYHERKARNLTARDMTRSKFCAVIPSVKSQNTIDLPLAIQSGCIPVFLGPPFHSMPMVLDVAYSKIAVFIHIVEHSKLIWDFDELHIASGELEPDDNVQTATIEVPDIVAAVEFLGAIPETVVEYMHQEVLKEQSKFRMNSKNKTEFSATDIAINRMCDYSIRMKAENELKARQKAAAPQENSSRSPKLGA